MSNSISSHGPLDHSAALELDARRLRLDVVRLAHALYETGCAEDGDNIRDTARKLLAFVDGEEATVST